MNIDDNLARKWRRRLVIALATVLVMSGGLTAGGVRAHPDHDVVIEAGEASQLASRIIAQLIGRNVLDASWKQAVQLDPVRGTAEARYEWMLAFFNAGIADPEQRTLYILLDGDGEVVATNYSGR